MKAITTGFAVTALAAAISGQAMAEATYEFSGEINVQSVFDLENDTRKNEIVDELDGDQDAFELTVKTMVTNGPFSGTLVIEEAADEAASTDPVTTQYDAQFSGVDVYIEDLIATEGKISFGQLGDVFTTDTLMETVADDDDAADHSFGVTGGLRYTDEELGLKVQVEGNRPGDFADVPAEANYFGASVALAQDVGMGTVYVEAQYAEDINNEARDTFIGVGAELMPTEELTVVAAYHGEGRFAGDSAYGVRATYAMDAMSAYGAYYDHSTIDSAVKDEAIMVGGSYTMDMLTFTADYTNTSAEKAGDEIAVGVAYANDNIAAYADVTLADFDADNADPMMLEVGASMTSEAGIVYAADYTNQAADAAAGVAAATSEVVLSASYSF